jgi:hypothetical protein
MQWRRSADRRGESQQAFDPLVVDPPHELIRAHLVPGQEHDLRPLRMLLPAVPVGDNRCQSRTIRRRDEKSKVSSH